MIEQKAMLWSFCHHSIVIQTKLKISIFFIFSRLIKSPSDLYLYIMDKSVQNEAIEYFNILNFDPKYDQLSMEDFKHCVSVRKTIRLKF